MTAAVGDRLRAATKRLHHDAEHSGVYRDLLRGSASIDAYALLLRNLEPVYDALERHLPRTSSLSPAELSRLARAPRIAADLEQLAGLDWPTSLGLLPESELQVERIETIARREPARLAGHVYTRYLGDLNGGQVLRTLLGKAGLAAAAQAYFDFGPEPVAELERRIRLEIDHAAAAPGAVDAIVDEAVAAFRMTIALSEAVASVHLREA